MSLFTSDVPASRRTAPCTLTIRVDAVSADSRVPDVIPGPSAGHRTQSPPRSRGRNRMSKSRRCRPELADRMLYPVKTRYATYSTSLRFTFILSIGLQRTICVQHNRHCLRPNYENVSLSVGRVFRPYLQSNVVLFPRSIRHSHKQSL